MSPKLEAVSVNFARNYGCIASKNLNGAHYCPPTTVISLIVYSKNCRVILVYFTLLSRLFYSVILNCQNMARLGGVCSSSMQRTILKPDGLYFNFDLKYYNFSNISSETRDVR